MDDYIVLTDEEGNETAFELLDVIPYQGEEYAVFLPADGEDERVHILQVLSEDLDSDEVSYAGIDDDCLIDKIYQLYLEKQ